MWNVPIVFGDWHKRFLTVQWLLSLRAGRHGIGQHADIDHAGSGGLIAAQVAQSTDRESSIARKMPAR
jgi:hypothetical protein